MEEWILTHGTDLLSPIAVGVAIYWIKTKLKNIDDVPSLVLEMRLVNKQLNKMEAAFERSERHREDFIVLKSEVKSQWKRLDELRESIREKP